MAFKHEHESDIKKTSKLEIDKVTEQVQKPNAESVLEWFDRSVGWSDISEDEINEIEEAISLAWKSFKPIEVDLS